VLKSLCVVPKAIDVKIGCCAGDLDEVVAAEVNSALRSLQIVDVPARAFQQRGQPRLERALCHQLYHGSPAIQLYVEDDFECLRHGVIHRPHEAG
jgi:hypothetical protein